MVTTTRLCKSRWHLHCQRTKFSTSHCNANWCARHVIVFCCFIVLQAKRDLYAITVRYPFGPLMFTPAGKDIENRDFSTTARRWIAVHYAKSAFSAAELQKMGQLDLVKTFRIPSFASLRDTGAIVGLVYISEVTRNSSSRWAIQGKWHWHIARTILLRRSVFATGARNLWPLDMDEIVTIHMNLP